MKLYYFPIAPNPTKVLVYLAEKGIELEMVRVDLTRGEQQAPEHLARNPAGRLPVLELEAYEADDLIATYTRLARRSGFDVVIVASDKDLYQLVGEGVTVLNPAKNFVLDEGGVEIRDEDQEEEIERFREFLDDVTPEDFGSGTTTS